MRAMVLRRPGAPLEHADLPRPVPAAGEVLIRIAACGVCRTDLHLRDGELPDAILPLVPGHEIVGRVAARGEGAHRFAEGDRVGVPWLGSSCGACDHCRAGRENLCARATFTGYHRHGGYAEWVTADERFCLPIPTELGDVEAAPFLCAGLIGYRALMMVEDAQRIGLYGFGAAGHLVAQVAVGLGREVSVFTRPGDHPGQEFARSLGAAWAGGSDQSPARPLDAAIIFAPVGALVPVALAAVRPGGAVVCAGIHMSDIPTFPYRLLWGERSVQSVANLTRQDGKEFFHLLRRIPIRSETTTLPLEEAEQALTRLRQGTVKGALVLVP